MRSKITNTVSTVERERDFRVDAATLVVVGAVAGACVGVGVAGGTGAAAGAVVGGLVGAVAAGQVRTITLVIDSHGRLSVRFDFARAEMA